MKTALLQLLAATADDPSVHIGHGLEKSGVKFDGMFRLGESEFRNGGVKLKLQALQQNGVEDGSFGALPAEDAVSEDQLDAFGLAVDPTIKRIKGLEELHRLPRRLFAASPFVTQHRPAPQRGSARRVPGELYG